MILLFSRWSLMMRDRNHSRSQTSTCWFQKIQNILTYLHPTVTSKMISSDFHTIGNHFIFLMPKLFWSDRWRYPSQWPVSQLWFSAVDSATVASQKCDYEINSVPSLVHFQHKKDQVTPNLLSMMVLQSGLYYCAAL